MEDYMIEFSDPGTERSINAVICQYGRDVFEDVDDLITPNTFTITVNQAIYKCIRHIFNTSDRQENIKLDVSLLRATIKELNYNELFKGTRELQIVDGLFHIAVEPTNARKYAAKIRKLEIRRLIYNQLQNGMQDLKDIPHDTPVEEVIASIEGKVLDFTSLLNEESNQTTLIGQGLDEYVDHVMENPCEMIGISTGYPLYDLAVGGLRRGAIQLIAARAKTGKSMLSINIGMHIAGKLGIKVLYLDSEMSKKDNYSRILANLSDVEINDIETGKFAKNKVKKAKVLEAKNKITNMPFYYVSIAGKSTEEILSIMRKWVNKTVGYNENGTTNDCVIIYDYIKIMDQSSISKNMQEYMAMGFLVSALNNFMVKYSVACLAFAQQNRDGVNSTSINNVAGSDRLSWYCSSVSSYSIKAEEDQEDCGDKYGNRKLVPLIARYGEGIGVGNYINMYFNGKKAQIKQGKDYFSVKANENNNIEEDYSDIDKISSEFDNVESDNILEAPWN